MHEGYLPYRDFGIPTGIGNFILPYLSFLAFGVNYNSLYIMQVLEHLFVMVLIALIFKKLFKEKHQYYLALSASYLVLALFVFLNVKCQFYNSEFYIYELLTFALVLNSSEMENKKSEILYAFLIAFSAFLTMQVKQDYGGILYLIVGWVLLRRAIKTRRPIGLMIFLVFSAVLWMIFIRMVGPDEFRYWFSMGQAHQPSRAVLARIADSIQKKDSVFLVVLIIIYGLSFYRLVKLKLIHVTNRTFEFLILSIGLGFQNIVTLATSNFPFLLYATPFLIPVIVVSVVLIGGKKLSVEAFAIVLLLGMIFSVKEKIRRAEYDFYIGGYLYHAYKKNLNQYLVPASSKGYGISYCNKHDDSSIKVCNGMLYELYQQKKSPLIMANFTDVPFDVEVPAITPKGFPLWQDNDVILFENEKRKYLEALRNKEFDVIFVFRLDFGCYRFTNYEFLKEAQNNYDIVQDFKLDKYLNNRGITMLVKRTTPVH